MGLAEQKNFQSPDETRTFDHGKMDVLHIGNSMVGKLVAQPGWRWSEHVKPVAGTQWCEVAHFGYQLSGVLHVQMADGTEIDIQAGDVTAIPPGHDAWVVGDEPVVVVDWTGASEYAKQ